MYESWYQEHYHEMSNAGLWFRGSGINILPPAAWEARPYRVLIVRLSTARDTADSFTHQLLYQIAASSEGVFADCAWLPPPEDGRLFDRDGVPWLTGAATKRPAAHFDCLAFSNAIVQELINLPTLLAKSGLPAGKRGRLERPDVPLVILGGANALHTSVLLGIDPAVDAVFIGEHPALIQDIFLCGQNAKRNGEDKQTLLKKLTAIPGIIEPDRPQPTRKPSFPLGGAGQLLQAPVFTGDAKIGAGTLAISEGCPCFCAFCAESWSRKPYREAEAEACLAAALAMKASLGLDRIDLYSFNFNMHRQLKDLLWELSGSFAAIGLKSQRLDGIAADPELTALLHAVNKSSLTAGIEGISQRLRRWLQKSLSEADLRTGVTRLLRSPLRELKLFFLATGREEKADFDEFRDLLAFISDTMERVRRRPRLIISMTPLVRFPFTPLEGEDAPAGELVRRTILQCERLVKAKRFEFRSAASMNEYRLSQMLVRAADPRIWPALCSAVKETGFVYYRDIPDSFMESWAARLAAAGVDAESLLRSGGSCGRLPVRLAVEDTFIGAVRRAGDAFEDLGHCLGSERAAGKCLGCGACRDEEERSRMAAPRARHSLRGEQLKARLQESNTCVTVHVACAIDASQRGVPRPMIAAEMARAFMAEDPLLLRLYRGCAGSLAAEACRSDWVQGGDVIALRFQEQAADRLKTLCANAGFLARVNAMLAGHAQALEIALDPPAAPRLTLRLTTGWPCDPERYCREHSLKFTSRRSGDRWLHYELTKDSLKKRLLQSMSMRQEGTASILEIVPGEKFDYHAFLRSAIALPAEGHIVRVVCETDISGRGAALARTEEAPR